MLHKAKCFGVTLLRSDLQTETAFTSSYRKSPGNIH